LLDEPWLQKSLDKVQFTAEFKDELAGIERVEWSLGVAEGDASTVPTQTIAAIDLDAAGRGGSEGRSRVLQTRQGSFIKRVRGRVVGVTKAVARVSHQGLKLTPGQEYFLTVTAVDGGGQRTSLVTRLVADVTPPMVGQVVDARSAREVRLAAVAGNLAEDIDYLALTANTRLTAQ
jgi:hypothetical protein